MFSIRQNRYGFSADQLFEVGKRDNNTKRNFLFISKFLGKHVPVKPEIVKATGFLLSSLKYDFDNASLVNCIKDYSSPDYTLHAKDSDVLVIGFCETATALGLSVAASIEGSTYIATTREPVYGIKQLVTFEEAHSHASTHFMYSNDISLQDFKKIILVDDEITTGNSLLHLMGTLIQNSNIDEISIMTILDWRNKEQIQKFEHFALTYGVEINIYSVVSGDITDDDCTIYLNDKISVIEDCISSTDLCLFPKTKITFPDGKSYDYLTDSGRFGIRYNRIQDIEHKAKLAATKISETLGNSHNLLLLGHGENMYIPSRIAAHLEKLGFFVNYKTTSRTPIYCDGKLFTDIQYFNNNGTKYHFYNKKEAEEYDKVIMISESNFSHKLCDNIQIFNL